MIFGQTASVRSIGILLVDDHPVVRDGFRRMIEGARDLRVVAEADDGESACVKYMECTPDVVVMDMSMPGIGGLEAIRRIRARDVVARILVFSMHDSEMLIKRTLAAGACGYLNKTSGMGQMLDAVRRVARGEMYLEAGSAVDIISKQLFNSDEDDLQALSLREFQLFQMLAEGHSVNEIADMLSLSPKTVGVHHANIKKKLNLKNDAQLVRLAIRCNVIRA